MNWQIVESITTAAAVSGILIVAEHYFPWSVILHGRKLPRLAAYILGMSAILLPFTYWMMRQPECLPAWIVTAGLWVIVCAAGLADVLCYALDKSLEFRSRALDAEERETRFRDDAGLSSHVSD